MSVSLSPRSARFLAALADRVLVCDGAMGTELYDRGISFEHCFDELNLSRGDLISEVHASYRDAGAEVLLTNTFGANRVRLASHGLEARVADINLAGARLARAVAGSGAFVAGSVGPIGKRLAPVGKVSLAEAEAIFAEQITSLATGGVDLLWFETFSDLAEISAAMRAASRVAPQLPMVAHMTFTDEGKTITGYKPEEVARALTELGAVAVGANCSVGPGPMMEVIERMLRIPDLKLSVQPNAGLPQVNQGRYVYITSPEYLADFARQFAQHGCHLVGGCCGTGPKHIRAIAQALAGARPSRPVARHATLEVVEAVPAPRVRQVDGPSSLRQKLRDGKFVSSVEIDPPRGINAEKLIRGAELCRSAGIDCINVADSPLARARMSPTALANLIRREVDIEIILHMSCRDRNVLGLQSELMGSYALGVRNVLCVTGDPPTVGDYPGATGVFDVDSIGLITLCSRLNAGTDLAGKKIDDATDVFIGCASNPTAVDLETEVDRFQKKIDAGCHFTMTQPLYELDSLRRFLDRTKPTIPVLLGILPLKNARHASFLHNEVPGMHVPEDIRARMERAGEDGPAEGVRIAREYLELAKPYVQGVYLMPPFNQFWMGVDVVRGIV